MSEYIKTNWQNGDVITAEKLNNIENGIADANSNKLIIIRSENDGYGRGRYVGTTIAPNLTPEDLATYKWYVDTTGMLPEQPQFEGLTLVPITIYSSIQDGKIIINVTIDAINSKIEIPYDIATGEIASNWVD